MKKDDFIFILHIRENIEKIENSLLGIDKKIFFKDKDKQDANIRRIEIIGDVTKNLSDKIIKKYDNVPWNDIVKTRDKLIHGYFGIDLELIWDMIKIEIPKLKNNIEIIVSDLER